MAEEKQIHPVRANINENKRILKIEDKIKECNKDSLKTILFSKFLFLFLDRQEVNNFIRYLLDDEKMKELTVKSFFDDINNIVENFRGTKK